MDTLNSVNEQLIQNLRELTKVQYSEKQADEVYEALIRMVSKNAKDSLNDAIHIQNAQMAASKKLSHFALFHFNYLAFNVC